MEKSLAEQYLDGDIEVEEYTVAVIEAARVSAISDRADRAYKLLENLGNSALEGDT